MLNQIRANRLTREQRLTAIQRALFCRPRFVQFESIFEAGVPLQTKKRSQLKVDYDTYFTSALFNSSAWFGLTGTSRIFMEMYTLYKNSLYRSNENRETLSSFITFDARFLTSVLPPFDDRQREFMPFLVEANDALVVETSINITPLADITTRAVLAGFMVTPNDYYPAGVLEQLNRSLDRAVRSEHFDIFVDHGLGRQIYRIQNDGFPRLLFGFGVSGEADELAPVVNMQSTVLITDLSRRLQFSETPIPIENFAPRIPMSKDQYVYYLPVEYYLEPFANLEFEIVNSVVDLPYTLTAHTRTV